MRFRSEYYPHSNHAFRIKQEYAMRYYAIFMFVLMLIVVLRVSYSGDGVTFGIIGSVVAIFLANLMAQVDLKRRIAEIFFVNDGFSIISVHDILHPRDIQSFPLKFANPTRSNDVIQFHYEDQIMTIKRENWGDDFELIWNWLNQNHMDFTSTT